MPRTMRLAAVARVPTRASGETLVAFNCGADKVIYLVYALRKLDYSDVHSIASFPKTVPQHPQKYRIVGLRDGIEVLNVVTTEEPFNIYDVQPLGHDLLLVCTRSHYRGKNEFEKNGRVYNREGSLVREFLLGDGIESVQTTAGGVIWTSFFDEGIFGNFGWSNPVGASGLVAWNASGEKLYEFQPPAGFDSMCDCYALNVESENVTWCYYYTEFPLVRLRNRKVESVWRIPVAGSDGFAVWRDHALFRGGYKERDTYRLYRLRDQEQTELLAELQLVDENGEPLLAQRIVTRGDAIYLLKDDRIYKVNVASVCDSCGAS